MQFYIISLPHIIAAYSLEKKYEKKYAILFCWCQRKKKHTIYKHIILHIFCEFYKRKDVDST